MAEAIAEKSYDSSYGARPLRRTVAKEIEDVISKRYLNGELEKNKKTVVLWANGELVFNTK